jgi:hypothetical protein
MELDVCQRSPPRLDLRLHKRLIVEFEFRQRPTGHGRYLELAMMRGLLPIRVRAH